jgi:hypothetical protein
MIQTGNVSPMVLIGALDLFLCCCFALPAAFELLVAEAVAQIEHGYTRIKDDTAPALKARNIDPEQRPIGMQHILHAEFSFPPRAQCFLNASIQ